MNGNNAWRFSLIFASVIAILAFSGCVQTSPPAACNGMAADKAVPCIYEQAVLEQNPFYCYSISDTSARATCMHAAIDPVMKKQLENSIRQGTGQGQGTVTAPDQPKVPQNATIAPDVSCDVFNGTKKDECLRAKAVAADDLLGCVKISDSSMKQACVSQVAQGTRDLDSCVNLVDKALRDLCRTYAKGETPSS